MNTWEYIWEWLTNTYNAVVGVILVVLGYLSPIKDVMHFMMLLFVLDVVFGYWKARKLKRAKFRPKIIWNKTVPRMLFSVVIVTLLYVWDDIYKQDVVSTYRIAGWFVSGLLIASILENMYKITGWKVFPFLSSFIKSNLEKKTGVEINEEKEVENE